MYGEQVLGSSGQSHGTGTVPPASCASSACPTALPTLAIIKPSRFSCAGVWRRAHGRFGEYVQSWWGGFRTSQATSLYVLPSFGYGFQSQSRLMIQGSQLALNFRVEGVSLKSPELSVWWEGLFLPRLVLAVFFPGLGLAHSPRVHWEFSRGCVDAGN